MTEIANNFCKRKDVQVHIVLYGKTSEIYYPVDPTVILHEPDFPFYERYRSYSTIKRLLFLRRKVKQIKPDSVLSFGTFWNSFVLLALYGLKYPRFVSDRGQPDRKLSFFHETLAKLLYPKATGIVAQTSIAKEIANRKFSHKNIEVIGNPIKKIDAHKPKQIKENIVLTVGRLIKSKHHDLLIDIFVHINEPGWKLVIAGGDSLKQQGMKSLQEKIRNLNAENKVVLAGEISNIDEYYLKSKIFAFTSSSEGFPNVVGEAMAAGLPVVSFDCVAGPSDMVKHGETGFLVELMNAELFEKYLRTLMNDS